MTSAVERYIAICNELAVKSNIHVLNALNGHTLSTLKRVDLSEIYFGPKQALVVCRLAAECSSIENINLAGNNVNNAIIEVICNLAERSAALASLDLSRNLLDIAAGQRILESLRRNPHLSKVHLHGTGLPDYLINDISVQLDLNALNLQTAFIEERNSLEKSKAIIPQCLECSQLSLEEMSNPQDLDDIAEMAETMMNNEEVVVVDATPFASDATIAGAIASAMTDNKPFQDSSFPLKFVVHRKFGPVEVEWIRFHDWCALQNIQPTCSGSSPVVPGMGMGLEWIHSATSVVAAIDGLRRGICSRALHDLGVYVFLLHDGGGNPHQVLVDDRIPIRRNADGTVTLLSQHHEDPTDAWAPLLEKAYAKRYGGYHKLQCGGSSRNALADFTGGVCCKSQWKIREIRHHAEYLFRWLRSHVIHRRTVAVRASAIRELECNNLVAMGLRPNELYVLSNVLELTSTTWVVQLTSPRAGMQWNGRFGQQSRELHEHLDLQTSCSSLQFWMPLEDFASLFDSAYVLWHVSKLDLALRTLKLEAQTTHEVVCDCQSNALWVMNPTYKLSTTAREATVVVRIIQPDARCHHNFTGCFEAGLMLHTSRESGGDDEQWNFSFGGDNLHSCTDGPVHSREVTALVTVHRDKPVCLTVSSTEPHVPFTVCASSSDVPFQLVWRDDSSLRAKTIRGKWSGLAATGRLLSVSDLNHSPQYLITASGERKNKVTVYVAVEQLGSQFSIGLQSAPMSRDLRKRTVTLDALTELTPHQRRAVVAKRITLIPDGDGCLLVPTTWNRHEENEFVVVVVCQNADIDIREL